MADQVAVVMVPLPSQSHLNQLLQLAGLISSYGLPVHYVGSATHNRQAKLRSTGLIPESTAAIQFHDLPTPPIATPEPSRGLDKLPVHMASANMAYMELNHPIGLFVRDLSTTVRKTVVIYDRFIAEAVTEAVSLPNVESYAFCCLSAFNMLCLMWESMGRQNGVDDDDDNDNDNDKELNKLPSALDFYEAMVIKYLADKPEHCRKRNGDIHNSSRLIEAKYLELLEGIDGRKKQWAIWPTLLQKSPTGEKPRHKCLEWLDKQAERSVVYVSFGTLVSLSDEEVRELALGLEESKTKFIWAIRDADKADIFAGEEDRRSNSNSLLQSEGFEERVGEDGFVVSDWAPQMEILSHRSVGGFMSHCGWNSCFESLIAGVPIVAWPMHTDQPLNAFFMTEILRTGLVVKELGQREEVLKASVVKNAVERLMSSEEGDEVRKRAEEISVAVNKSMEEGGEYWRELESFIADIRK